MQSQILITTVGPDRPGIVEDIAGWVMRHGGNIEDSRMAALAGEFATIILVAGDDAFATRLADTHKAFEGESGLTVFLRPVTASAGSAAARLRYTLVATSLDQAGIVHRIAGLLRAHSINIVSAETRREFAPFSGAPIFQLEMEIDIPSAVSVPRLRTELENFGERENIDITLAAV